MSLAIEQFEAITFDHDGVFANTIPLYAPLRIQACELIADQTGDERYRQIPQEIHEKAHRERTNSYDCTKWVLVKAGIIRGDEVYEKVTDDPVWQLLDIREDLLFGMYERGEVPPVPGAIETALTIAEVLPEKIAIGTTANKDKEVLPFLRTHGLDSVIDPELVVGKHDVAYLKPFPDVYYETARRLGLRMRESKMVVVEDLPKGISAANQAGAFAIALATTYTVAEWRQRTGFEMPSQIAADYEDFGALMLTSAAEAAAL